MIVKPLSFGECLEIYLDKTVIELHMRGWSRRLWTVCWWTCDKDHLSHLLKAGPQAETLSSNITQLLCFDF